MPDPLASPANPPGTMPVEQRFELLGRIGAGSHGVVFRARDRQLQRDVAIKRFSHFLADDPRAMRRIKREVAALARVSHPHVVTVHDLVHMADGDGEITPRRRWPGHRTTWRRNSSTAGPTNAATSTPSAACCMSA